MKLVIKVGTSTITDKNGVLNGQYISAFAQAVARLKKENNEILIVSSGAIGAGLGRLKLQHRPSALREKQALAAIGQPLIMNAYAKSFSLHNMLVAQVLLTRDDFENRVKYINARNTLCELIERNVVPIINENDTVAVEEINFGDNDTLAALTACAVDADILIILTDVDGLYDGIPSKSKLIDKIEKITPEIEKYATRKSSSGKGIGGMSAKIAAAKIAVSSGVDVIITNGSKLELLNNIAAKEKCGTLFKADKRRLEAKKSWIAFGKKPKGNIVVDKKAAQALIENGKSLLAAGIVKASGNFKRGDTVIISEMESKKDFARGLVNFDSAEMQKIKGKKSKEIQKIIASAEEEAVHRDNLVIIR
ncbi:MAG: glutamate 5-kinase [Endomicrobium sp.]|jgi:glutamate 5-kinase|nr:glutamate 5-kinase [Endomicrobium sp.]